VLAARFVDTVLVVIDRETGGGAALAESGSKCARFTQWPISVPDPIGLCALADAEFHRAVYGALGINVVTADGMWWAERPASPVMMTGGTVAPIIDLTKVRTSGSFAIAGRTRTAVAMAFRAGSTVDAACGRPIEIPDVAGLTIDRAVDPAAVLAFERATVEIGGGLRGITTARFIRPGRRSAASTAPADW